MVGIPRYKEFNGPALFRQGFRPFFLGAGLWAGLAILIWLIVIRGDASLPSNFPPAQWHAHEMLFGFAAAAATGFLLTAIPNWTGRMPLQGVPLIVLFGVWVLGRVAMSISDAIGDIAAAALDLAFLALLFGVVLREILAGRNWRNLPVVIAVGVLFAANAITHLEVNSILPSTLLGERLGVAVFVILISLIGGRIIPSFTRNWLVKRDSPVLPVPFSRFDTVTLVLVLVASAFWVALPTSTLTAFALIAAGAISAARLVRWQGWRTYSEPLLWVLHLGYAWVAFGLVLLAGSVLFSAEIPYAAGLHALTAGAIGTMILAVMTRASRGHTGHPLTVGLPTAAIYALVTLAAVMRTAAPFTSGSYLTLVSVSGWLWISAFALFAILYGPILLGDRPTTSGVKARQE
ncbi:NnrS family protein [Methyloligella solikamskensis]|uniref:NnrS family protein n=1 Tax=Methyloligella solikamskensis TaxID=1177756 RepID=A0ABW3J6R2_9HYPH